MEILLNPETYATEVFDFKEAQSEKVQKINEETLQLMTKSDKKEKVKERNSTFSFRDVGGLENVITKLKKGIIYPIEFPYAYKSRKNLNHGSCDCDLHEIDPRLAILAKLNDVEEV